MLSPAPQAKSGVWVVTISCRMFGYEIWLPNYQPPVVSQFSSNFMSGAH
jgi:hypothetical protein